MAGKMTTEQQIAHFLRLSEDKGATQEERDLAASQAERLMIKHGIDRVTAEGSDERPAEKITTTRVWIAGTYAYDEMSGLVAVAHSLKLQAYYTDYRNYGRFDDSLSGKVEKGVMMTVVGFEGDLADAVSLMTSLRVQAKVAVDAFAKTTFRSYMTASEKYKARRSFIQGFHSGAADRIRKERATVVEEAGTGTALVLVDRAKQVDAYYAGLGLRASRSRRESDWSGRSAGYAAGQNANTGGRGSAALGR